MGKKNFKPQCKQCGDEYSVDRWKLGIMFCLACGDTIAKSKVRTVVPMHKSNYFLCVDLDDLKGINNKGGIVK